MLKILKIILIYFQIKNTFKKHHALCYYTHTHEIYFYLF